MHYWEIFTSVHSCVKVSLNIKLNKNLMLIYNADLTLNRDIKIRHKTEQFKYSYWC